MFAADAQPPAADDSSEPAQPSHSSGPAIRPTGDIGDLLAIMAALRDPLTGCPWDVAQDFATIAPYTIEEAYEVADAVARGDLDDLRDELGDLLLQVVFHARLAEERGRFGFPDVVRAISTKLVRRHPHVFGDAGSLTSDQVKSLWHDIKLQEAETRRSARGEAGLAPPSALEGVAAALPALSRADKLARKAAAVGFTWTEPGDVVAKIEEELAEVRAAIAGRVPAEIAEEIGDLLFTVANLARYVDVDPEDALRRTNRKFERRFRWVEAALAARGRGPATSDLKEMDRLWEDAKALERAAAEG